MPKGRPRCNSPRRGIGTALLRHLEAAHQSRGCLKVNLQVRASNRQVIAFNERLGYAVEERASMGKRLYLPSLTAQVGLA
jgi:ribosomal protein S18 acetylase RimI-like enzyme